MIKFNVRKVLDSHHCQQRAHVTGYFNEDTKSIITPEAIECSDVESRLDPLALSVLLDSNAELMQCRCSPGLLVLRFKILQLFGSP